MASGIEKDARGNPVIGRIHFYEYSDFSAYFERLELVRRVPEHYEVIRWYYDGQVSDQRFLSRKSDIYYNGRIYHFDDYDRFFMDQEKHLIESAIEAL